MGSGVERGLVEANVCDRIYLENRIFGIVDPWGQDVWLGATRGVQAERISCTLQGLT